MISTGEGKYTVFLTHVYVGKDLLVIITGGNKHIGGVSLVDNGGILSIIKQGHKDDIISSMVAPIIYEKTKKDTLVICGIHLDNITKDGIDILINNARICTDKLLKAIDE